MSHLLVFYFSVTLPVVQYASVPETVEMHNIVENLMWHCRLIKRTQETHASYSLRWRCLCQLCKTSTVAVQLWQHPLSKEVDVKVVVLLFTPAKQIQEMRRKSEARNVFELYL